MEYLFHNISSNHHSYVLMVHQLIVLEGELIIRKLLCNYVVI